MYGGTDPPGKAEMITIVTPTNTLDLDADDATLLDGMITAQDELAAVISWDDLSHEVAYGHTTNAAGEPQTRVAVIDLDRATARQALTAATWVAAKTH
ncbi:hypothetical protein SEA_BROWNIE5_86 [Mycobacterium phage Brownie5]|uniref:Uncharacterized protein n=6 Tax=Rosebushvirus TaxID=1982900 RepID=A0A649VT96_9CAUD|nr:hypothetical protein HEDGEROW_86 [Mycobacterium phage Hedgerow]AER48708.1 hypothetical protein ARES_86 [Mycobacterium phage Ares]AXH69103.1 hypothetical protein SABELLA_86 [Mycobacterium phage Sabella]AXQ52564.1 hypothetical protein SEA_FRENCHFRY_87 [Mycobacterium phage FrenchFry]QGJ95686.1 hypothetical protein SEA_BROWNIE5_86 [Mycobacterium phage Brownie5]QGJ95778.1 hypothetical protein SEA_TINCIDUNTSOLUM_87 [Mycobacterium phage Tinciduntsolum]